MTWDPAQPAGVHKANRTEPAEVELALELTMTPDRPSGLRRAIATLHRRQWTIVSARFRSNPGDHARLTLRLRSPPRQAHLVATWLASLVDVFEVQKDDGQWGDDHLETAATAMREDLL